MKMLFGALHQKIFDMYIINPMVDNILYLNKVDLVICVTFLLIIHEFKN